MIYIWIDVPSTCWMALEESPSLLYSCTVSDVLSTGFCPKNARRAAVYTFVWGPISIRLFSNTRPVFIFIFIPFFLFIFVDAERRNELSDGLLFPLISKPMEILDALSPTSQSMSYMYTSLSSGLFDFFCIFLRLISLASPFFSLFLFPTLNGSRQVPLSVVR